MKNLTDRMSKYLSSYVNACRSAMRFDIRDTASWTELAGSLVAARHAMICCVCGRLLRSPTGPAQSTCYHYYCRACVGGKTRYMKGSCGWCKDTTDFVAENHLESVIRCFRQLCVYLKGFITPLAKSGQEMDTVMAVVNDAVEKQDADDDILLTVSSSSPTDKPSDVASSLAAVTSPDMSKIPQDSRPQISKLNSLVQHNSVKRKRKYQSSDLHRKRSRPYAQTYVSPAHSSVSLCLLTNTDGSVSDLQLGNSLMETVTWSDNVSHPHLHDVDQHIDVEETLVGGVYDTQWSLLENPVLAEHDYNKLTTSFNAATTVSAPSHVSGSPAKLTKSPTAKKTSCKRSSTDKGISVRKPSLTIRQLSEGNGTGTNAGCGMKVVDGGGEGSVPRRQKSSAPKVKIGCRCAMATPTPGKLTCCGQRCPCYAAFHGCCPSCKCRGCRNPRGDPAKSPLIGTTVRPSSTDQVQCNLPLFDSAGSVFSSVNKDHIVVHSPSRFSTESISC